MDSLFSSNSVSVSVKKHKNSYITLVENLPADRIDSILSACRTKFGCGGSVLKKAAQPTIQLQGDQKYNVEKVKDTIFSGLELTLGFGKQI